MKFKIVLFAGLSILVYSFGNQPSKINGYWKATFNDSIENPLQYLEIKKFQNNLTINIDEPNEDWYNIPGEKIYLQNDSLHFERFWGLEKYDGISLPGDSVTSGIKQIQNKRPIPFTISKVANNNTFSKVPRSGPKGEYVLKYSYNIPVKYSDLVLSETLNEVGIDSVKIYDHVNKILTKQIPNIHSLLILKDNKLVLEEYFYGYSIDKTHRVHSVTKSITSALFGIAIDKNLSVTADEPVWKY